MLHQIELLSLSHKFFSSILWLKLSLFIYNDVAMKSEYGVLNHCLAAWVQLSLEKKKIMDSQIPSRGNSEPTIGILTK